MLGIRNMHKYEDWTHGLKGYLIWGMIFGLCLYLFSLCLSTFLVLRNKIEFSEHYIGLLLFFFASVAFVLWMLSAIKFARETHYLYLEN